MKATKRRNRALNMNTRTEQDTPYDMNTPMERNLTTNMKATKRRITSMNMNTPMEWNTPINMDTPMKRNTTTNMNSPKERNTSMIMYTPMGRNTPIHINTSTGRKPSTNMDTLMGRNTTTEKIISTKTRIGRKSGIRNMMNLLLKLLPTMMIIRKDRIQQQPGLVQV